MPKLQKSYRIEESSVKDLQKLVDFYNIHMTEFSVKKASSADIISLLIQKEIELLRRNGSNI